jgi:hypothetical protein
MNVASRECPSRVGTFLSRFRDGREGTFVSLFCLLGILGIAAGCGEAGGAKMVPVAGKVTVDGKPLPMGGVVFRPDAARGNTSPHDALGKIDKDGSYRLSTDGKPGVPAGWYQVMVFAMESVEEKPDYQDPPTSRIDARYNNAETSGLRVEVVDAPASGAYDLKLTGARGN